MLYHTPHRNEIVGKSTNHEGRRYGIDCGPISPYHTDRGMVARRIPDNFGNADRIISSVLQTGNVINGVGVEGISPAEIMAAAVKVPKPKLKKYKLFI
jgi:hypothetical protein